MDLIPLPRKITTQDGLFLIGHNTAIVLEATLDDNDLETAKLLQQEIKKVIAITLPIKKFCAVQEIFRKTAFTFNMTIWIKKGSLPADCETK